MVLSFPIMRFTSHIVNNVPVCNAVRAIKVGLQMVQLLVCIVTESHSVCKQVVCRRNDLESGASRIGAHEEQARTGTSP